MTCTTAHYLIQESLDTGSADPVLDGHLNACAACRTYQEDMRRVICGLEAEAGDQRAPLELLQRLGMGPGGKISVHGTRRRWLPLGVAAAGMVIVFGLGHRMPTSESPVTTAASTPTETVAEAPSGEAILSWFGPDENAESVVEPL